VLYGQWEFYTVRGEYKTTYELGEQLLSLVQCTHDPTHFLQAHVVQGNALLWFGELVFARAHVEQALALYDPQRHHSLTFLSGTDPGVLCGFWAAQALGYLGYPDQAQKKSDQALTLARELAHPMSLVFALFYAAIIHQLRGEGPAAQERIEAWVALSTEQGLASFVAVGTFFLGWVQAARGQKEEGIAQMRQGLTAMQTEGAGSNSNQVSQFLALLAGVCGEVGQVEEGLAMLAEALAVVDRIGERYYEAELYRLKGELVLQSAVRSPESQEENQKSKGKRQKSKISDPRPLTPKPKLRRVS
jgi:adenylate cyclase